MILIKKNYGSCLLQLKKLTLLIRLLVGERVRVRVRVRKERERVRKGVRVRELLNINSL